VTNKLFYGDNLDVLRRKIESGSVDLCYIDPPFNSKRNYFQIYNNQGSEDRAQAQAFVDTWTWEDDAIKGLDYILDIERLHPRAGETRWTEQTVELIRGLEKVLGRGSLLAYLVHMTLRIVEIHRVLKPTGSFYLHCDPTASHYLKLVLDAVFCGQGGLFQNEIVWKRTGHHSPRASFGPVHDTIFYYTKSLNFVFNIVRKPYMKGHVENRYKRQPDGRYKFSSGGNVLTGAGWTAGPSGEVWRRFNPKRTDRHWAVPSFYDDLMPPEYQQLNSLQKLDALFERGLVEDDGTSAWPIMVRYLDERDGTAINDVWAYQAYTEGTVFGTKGGIDEDVKPLGPTDPERLGYHTQKPEGLLERIIKASSNEGDVVLDAYCGCGTTVAAAQRLNRQWIGIDITYQSIALILKRFQDTYEKNGTWPEVEANILLDGVPRDLESAMALAHRKDDKTRKEFEKWAVLTFSKNQARINEKKGADGGIDGIAYFLKDKGENGKAVFQVKSRNGTRQDLSTLNSDRQRVGADFGFLICTGPMTLGKAMRDEIAAAGKYKHPLLNREDDRLQVIFVAELFAPHNHRLDLPMARADAVKTAQALGDADKQESLF
jgi:DNA modification methylase